MKGGCSPGGANILCYNGGTDEAGHAIGDQHKPEGCHGRRKHRLASRTVLMPSVIQAKERKDSPPDHIIPHERCGDSSARAMATKKS
jgi:hypothetical protein